MSTTLESRSNQSSFQSVGFPRSSKSTSNEECSASKCAPAATPATRAPASLSKPPKGRLFISCILLTFIFSISWMVWSEFFRYSAYGKIQGSIVSASPNYPARIAAIHAKVGDIVEAGQLLATLDIPTLQQERNRCKRELDLAVAGLQMRQAEVQSRICEIESQDASRRLDYYRLLGEFHMKKAELISLEATYQVNAPLNEKNVISDIELLESQTEFEGLQSQLQDLEFALAKLKPKDTEPPLSHQKLLIAESTQVELVKQHLDEIDAMLKDSEVRATTRSRVLRQLSHTGEHLQPGEPVFDLVEVESVEIVLYVPQFATRDYPIGQQVVVSIPALQATSKFVVTGMSPEVTSPPSTLQNRYRANRGVASVRLLPNAPQNQRYREELSRWIGAEVSTPRLTLVPSLFSMTNEASE